MRQLKIIGGMLLVAALATAWALLTQHAPPGSATGLLAAVFLGLPAALLLEYLGGLVLAIAQDWPRAWRLAYTVGAMLLLVALCAGPVYVVRNWGAG